jgi:hypothetical protein
MAGGWGVASMRGPTISTLAMVALGALMLALAGCSRATGAGATKGSEASSNRAAGVANARGNACDRKLVSKDDVAGLLSEPIKSVEPLVGDAQSCQFISTNDSTVTVSLRPRLGNETLAEITSGQTNQTFIPLGRIGDKAVWNPVLKEVNATKDNLLCDVGVVGPASGPASAEKVGAICNKIFGSK